MALDEDALTEILIETVQVLGLDVDENFVQSVISPETREDARKDSLEGSSDYAATVCDEVSVYLISKRCPRFGVDEEPFFRELYEAARERGIPLLWDENDLPY